MSEPAADRPARDGAARFVDFLSGAAAGETFRTFGFVTQP